MTFCAFMVAVISLEGQFLPEDHAWSYLEKIEIVIKEHSNTCFKTGGKEKSGIVDGVIIN